MKEKKGLKYWFYRFIGNVKSFFKHPIQYIKKWIDDFKKCSTRDKVIKVILTALGAFIAYKLIIAAIVIFVFLIFLSGFISVPPSVYREYEDEDTILFEKQRQEMYNRNKQH